MRRRFAPYKSILNAVERAKKLKDLELAKSLEISKKNIGKNKAYKSQQEDNKLN